MKKLVLLASICAAFALILCAPGAARADTVTMKFTGVGGASSGGYYVYPYYFTLQGASGTWHRSLVCIDFQDEISVGQSWTANVVTAASLGQQYEEAAFLYSLGVKGTITNWATLNWALWELFDPHLAQTDLNALLAEFVTGQNIDWAKYGNYLVFEPSNGMGGTAGGAQWFLGTPDALTPEPGTLLLMGTGILALALALRFGKRTSQRADGSPGEATAH